MELVNSKVRFVKDKKWSTSELELKLEEKKLTIFYTPKTNRSFFSIADLSGKVLATVPIQKEGITIFSLCDLDSANYQLNLVDGEDMLMQVFNLPA